MPCTVVSKSLLMSLSMTFMLDPANEQMNCARARGSNAHPAVVRFRVSACDASGLLNSDTAHMSRPPSVHLTIAVGRFTQVTLGFYLVNSLAERFVGGRSALTDDQTKLTLASDIFREASETRVLTDAT